MTRRSTITSTAWSTIRRAAQVARRTGKRILGKYPPAMIPALLTYNLYWALRWSIGRAETEINATTSGYNPHEAASYLERVFESYRALAGVEHFHGTIAEIGPGGNAGVALLLRHDGADQVDLVDRFVIRSDSTHQSDVYSELSRRHDLDRFRVGSRWDGRALSGVSWHEGLPAEEFFRSVAAECPDRYDFILSHTVLQHLYDPLGAIRDMIACLRPGGKIIHRIDLRDQNFFSQAHHELTWLTVPTVLWPYLTRYVGGPNRVLAHRYWAFLEEFKVAGVVKYSVLVTRLAGVGTLAQPLPADAIDSTLLERSRRFVESKRSSFAREFREVPAADLSQAGIVLIIEKC